jgi:uncharacterized protein (TIGR03790 family)
MRVVSRLVLWCLWGLPALASSFAGGGPENVLLVVNSASEASKTVANHYIDLRKIPSGNVFYLNYPAGRVAVPSSAFRARILEPIFKEIEKRELADRIDYIVYSSDFPWRVDFKADFPGEAFPRGFTPTASLNSATYLHAFVMQKRKEMFSLNANFYCSPPNDLVAVSRACRANYRWTLGGRRAGQEGLPYMLSAVLGISTVPGNTLDEIANYLGRSAKADGSAPPGTIYYAVNKTVRSTTRDREFPQAVRLLQLAGVRAEIVQDFFPQYKQDIAGVTCGHSIVSPLRSNSRILPGAFCDNLTSSGGQFLPDKKQTLLTEFLRMGAAGACGTVVEPTALPQKFPNYTMQVHYAHGCSLAESFYQSVGCPYQQILVGDPLCQPWARIPKVTVAGVSEGAMVKGAVEIVPTATVDQGTASSFELFVDGAAAQKCLPGERIKWDTSKLADGHHELRVVAWDNTPIETQGRWIGSVVVKNGMDAVQLSADPNSLAESAPALTLRIAATNGAPTAVMFNGVELGKVESGSGSVAIDKTKLGKGPITLVAVAEGTPGLRSRPLRIVLSRK